MKKSIVGKIVALCLVLLMTMGMVACQQQPAAAQPAQAEAPAAETPATETAAADASASGEKEKQSTGMKGMEEILVRGG